MYQKQESIFNESIFRAVDAPRLNEDVQEKRSVKNIAEKNNIINGRIIGVSADSSYRRVGLRKIFDKIFYGQKMSNNCNTIVVRCKDGDYVQDVHVYIYGKLSGGISELKVGSIAEVSGRFDSKNRFLARKIVVDSVTIGTQIEMLDLLFGLVPILLLFIATAGGGAMSAVLENDVLLKFAVFFIGGFWATLRGVRRFYRYYLPWEKRMKIGAIGGAIISIILTSIFW